ncbi:sodium-independent sulfate anion transporter-like [Diorhabda carinulata]|uniref:sodium-independent sulfate anion transporter-like n=1 Tax=Diorhabda carinulata TaxID=1163345 RepID=UPI0025A260BA|nr:sodium-independent sulfate anion transporter-like [Diorhabda carinulata]
MMPQSIAYAGLAGLPAQYGLYTAFIGSFTYIFVGTIKEVSIGPTSLMSLLTFGYTVGKPIEFVILLTFIAGCVELLMGMLRLGFIVDFISPCLTSGFTSAATIIIGSAQLKNLLGINLQGHNAPDIMKELFQKYNQLRVYDTVMGFICIIVLLVIKNMNKFIKTENPTFKKIIWLLGISKNALVVLGATIVAASFSVDGQTPFKITGNVPKGVPEVQFPFMSAKIGNETVGFVGMMKSIGSGAFVVPFVGILSNVAIAKSYSKNSIVDASQEMMSLGLANIFGSFVKAMPSSGAFTRSAVASSSDVRTPLQGLYSGTVIVLALSFLAPYFFFIPKAALAAVLIVAVSSLFDYQIFPVLWKSCKVDFFITLGTLISGALFGVEIAIIVGAIFNVTTLLKVWARPKLTVEVKKKDDCRQMYLLIKPELGLTYPGADYVSECIKKTSKEYPTLPMVLDCQNILKLDYAAAKTLENILECYNETETSLLITNMKEEVFKIFETVADPALTSLCSKTNHVPEAVVLNIDVQQDKEENPLLEGTRERKHSKSSSVGTIKSLHTERRLSRGSFKGDRRTSNVSHRSDTRRSSIMSKNNERKLSIYDLE